ncbi:MAG: hypothetical protein KBS66_01395, partial [Eubacterium sp.]|nr:hypothetical protein [Candidatus Colimonas fimequi]
MRLKGYKAKIVSILLILTMVFSQSTTVFASANPEDAAEPTAPAAIEAPAPAPAPAEKPKAEEPKAQPTDSTVDKASKSEEATEVTEEAKAEENTEAKADTETTAAAEAEETEATTIEAEEEAVRPAQVLKVTAGDGAVITVRAPDGALEDGASVRAKRVNSSSVENAVENAVEAEGHNLVGMKAYDITIINADGKEVQPDKTVKVTISNTGLGSDGENTVYHVAGGNAKKVADVASGNKATFSTPHFSIYAVTDEEVAGKLATYEFYVGDNKVSTQIAKEGEKLVAPEVPTSEGKSFVGWTIDGEVINLDDYTSVGNDQTISVKAKFADSLYVYFYNADGSKIMKTEVVTDHKSHDFSAVTYDAGSTKKVTGFAAAPNGKKNIADAITVPEGETGINVYGIEVEGVWISFDADGGVAVNPEFLNAGEGIKLPTTTKNGYKL